MGRAKRTASKNPKAGFSSRLIRPVSWTQAFYFATGQIYMAVRQYGGYTLVSRPYLDTHLAVWIPYASVLRNDPGAFVYHRFTELDQTFLTEEAAEAYGFMVARAWVDQKR